MFMLCIFQLPIRVLSKKSLISN